MLHIAKAEPLRCCPYTFGPLSALLGTAGPCSQQSTSWNRIDHVATSRTSTNTERLQESFFRSRALHQRTHVRDHLICFPTRQLRYLGRTAPPAPLTASAVGGQVPDVGKPHYRDVRMQHSPCAVPYILHTRLGKLRGLARSRSA